LDYLLYQVIGINLMLYMYTISNFTTLVNARRLIALQLSLFETDEVLMQFIPD
jgi:hypothetical protein